MLELLELIGWVVGFPLVIGLVGAGVGNLIIWAGEREGNRIAQEWNQE